MAQSTAHKHDSTRRAAYQDMLDVPAHLIAEVVESRRADFACLRRAMERPARSRAPDKQEPRAMCSGLQSSSVLLANIGDFCSDYLRLTDPEYSRSLRTCSHCVRRTCNHRLVLTIAANDSAGGGRSRVRPTVCQTVHDLHRSP